jgi:hypothetical protein
MEDQPTCGKGLAEHSAIPRSMGAFAKAVARVLETHAEALDSADADAREEHAAYSVLVEEHRSNAAALTATADRMAGYRDLPMGRHDESVMSGQKAMQAFEDFVRAEQELLALLQPLVEQDQAMLAEMRGVHDE